MWEADEETLRNCRRWLIVGAGGAGKTHLSERLARRLGLPLVHLDQHYWRPGWVESEPEEWARRVEALAAQDAWVMDGNYSGSLEMRARRACVAILLDPPTLTCLWGVVRRSVTSLGRVRPDLAEGCPEQLPSLDFLTYVASYRKRSRPKVLDRLARAGVPVIRLTSRREVRDFLEGIDEARSR